MKILSLPGSLRAASINSYGALSELPQFNPDREADCQASVLVFQRAVAGADGLLIATARNTRTESQALSRMRSTGWRALCRLPASMWRC